MRATGRLLAAFLFVLGLYAAAVGVLGLVETGGEDTALAAREGIEMFVTSNGVHTDFVLPVVTPYRDWRPLAPNAAYPFLAIGWGDRDFYLATPTWNDLKASTALRAAFGLNGTVLHVESMGRPVVSDRARALRLSPDQYRRLLAYVEAGFARDAANGYRRIAGAHYNADDAFYEATGRYSVIVTCNEWAREGLAAAGVRVPLWSPFTWSLFR